MIQDIAPHQFDNTYRIQTPHAQDIVLYFEKAKCIVSAYGTGGILPRFESFDEEIRKQAQYLFCIDGIGFTW